MQIFSHLGGEGGGPPLRHIRWGIIGAGDASRRFAHGLSHVTGTRALSTWARRYWIAQAFAAEFGGSPAPSIEAFWDAPTDAVYIGTHPDSHRAFALAAIAAGKHVLCEKPSMLNLIELDEVLAAARKANLLFMEAMKPPFFPVYRKLREHLQHDPVGQVGFVRAGSSLADLPRLHALYNPGIGGGALLGIAPYEAFLALDWLGPLYDMQTMGRLGESGVDTFASLQTSHEHGIAQLYCGLGLHGHGDALLVAPRGNIAIPAKWWNPSHATIRYLDGRIIEIDGPIVSSGFNYETEHFCELLRSGATVSPVMTHEMSRQMMHILDQARATIGMVYPQEV